MMKIILVLLTAILSSSSFAEEITFNYSFQDFLKNVKDRDEITCPITKKGLDNDKNACRDALVYRYYNSLEVDAKEKAALGNRTYQNYTLKEDESHLYDISVNVDCAWTQTATTITCKVEKVAIINAVNKVQSVLKVNNLIHKVLIPGKP